MPEEPDWIKEGGIDIGSPRGRFNLRPAVAITVGEEIWQKGPTPAEALQEVDADWLLEEIEPDLGRPEAHDGSAGRGAEGWVAVVQWLGEMASSGIIEISIGYALARMLARLRDWRNSRDEAGEVGGFEVSRGMAAYLAGAHVADAFEETGPLEIEAVEEPSSIAGHGITEISFVGVEPWIVLLRNRTRQVRYVVVVMPDGSVKGALRVPFLPFEDMFLS